MDCKQLRKAMSPAGWSMVLYYILINVCVFAAVLVEMLIGILVGFSKGNMAGTYDAVQSAASGAWGYFLAAGVGIIILLMWKKPRYWKEELWERKKPMQLGDFFSLLAVFLAFQLVYQIYAMVIEAVLNLLGLTMMEGLEAMSAGAEDFTMFLYMCILAPVTEELLCRGLVQRTLMPYGKKLAILGSAFLFGMFHGNILQTPFAFTVGLVLGYVACEYSIAWAMVLHMINNLVLGDMLTRLTSGMGEWAAGMLLWSVFLISFIGAVIVLVRKRRQIRQWHLRNILGPTYTRCFFSSAGVVTFTVLMALMTVVSCFMMITPL